MTQFCKITFSARVLWLSRQGEYFGLFYKLKETRNILFLYFDSMKAPAEVWENLIILPLPLLPNQVNFAF